MLKWTLRALSCLPLPFLYALGGVLGEIAYFVAGKDRRRIRRHLRIAQLPDDHVAVRRILRHTVRGGLELCIAFFRQPEEIGRLFTRVHGWHHVENAMANGQGLLFLTPHLGSYDLAGRYLSERLPFPLTAMYKPSKSVAMDEIMREGRLRGKGKIAPTNVAGVKRIIGALRRKEAVILLPDHVPTPNEGEGVWVKFFGKRALTMTLAGRLANMDNVCPLFFVGERLPKGAGFALHIAPFSGELNGDKAHDAQMINDEIEAWVRRFPAQYLFAYNRYKTP